MKFFISYGRQDAQSFDLAQYLYEKLRERQHEVFVDQALLPGVNWTNEIVQHIVDSDFFVLLLSSPAIKSEIVLGEVRIAKTMYQRNGRPIVVPVKPLSLEQFDDLLLDSYLARIQHIKWEEGGDSQILSQLLMLSDDLRERIERSSGTAQVDEKQVSEVSSSLPDEASSTDEARDLLENALTGRDPEARRDALKFLRKLNAEQAGALLPLVTTIAENGSEEASLRAEAVLTLADLISEPEPKLWPLLSQLRDMNDWFLKAAATWAWCEMGRFHELGLTKVPAGEFVMGSEGKEGYPNETPQHRLSLPSFYIGIYPVTFFEFRKFLEEMRYPDSVLKRFVGPRSHPVVFVDWFDSLLYARSQGLTLPSEAEWEKAARGTDGRLYPWGNEWKRGFANVSRVRWFKKGIERMGGTTAVGKYSPRGDSPYGCADMAGNVLEWTRTQWGLSRYPYAPKDGREDLNVLRQGSMVLRGGSCLFGPKNVRCAYRYETSADTTSFCTGFRVVSTRATLESWERQAQSRPAAV